MENEPHLREMTETGKMKSLFGSWLFKLFTTKSVDKVTNEKTNYPEKPWTQKLKIQIKPKRCTRLSEAKYISKIKIKWKMQ